MAAARQRHLAVPSSNSPPISEWCHPFWYVIRTAALQASPKLNDADAALLVSFFESLRVTLPCTECSTNYIQDWASFPFTLAEAKSTDAAMHWVEELRLRIEKRRKPLVAAAHPSPAAPAPAARFVPAVARRSVAAPPAPPSRRAVLPASHPSARTLPARAVSASGDARQRQLAIQAALQETSANRAGPRGCNCGKRR
jgi:hypothetical protein